MKKLSLLFLVTFAVIVSSCGEDEDGGGTPRGNSLSARITGDVTTNFSASGEVQNQPLVQATITSQVLSIVATGSGSDAISMALTGFTGAGTYDMGLTSGNTFSFTTVDISTLTTKGFANTSGTVTVTETDNGYSATFNMEATGTSGNISVSNGKFNIITD